MSRHIRWDKIKDLHKDDRNDAWTQDSLKYLIAFHRGYILALEDIISDLGMQQLTYQYGYHVDASHVLEMAKEKIQGTLLSSQASLTKLLEGGYGPSQLGSDQG